MLDELLGLVFQKFQVLLELLLILESTLERLIVALLELLDGRLQDFELRIGFGFIKFDVFGAHMLLLDLHHQGLSTVFLGGTIE